MDPSFPSFPVVLETVYNRLEPWLQERNPSVRAERPRHGFQEAPSPPRPKRVSHGRAGGRNRATAAEGPPSSRDQPRKAPWPQKALHQGFPPSPGLRGSKPVRSLAESPHLNRSAQRTVQELPNIVITLLAMITSVPKHTFSLVIPLKKHF